MASIVAERLIARLERDGFVVMRRVRIGTKWFFNIDEHPIRAIGIVAGGLILTVSLIITLLNAALPPRIAIP